MSCPKTQYHTLPWTEDKQSTQASRHQYPAHYVIVSLQSKLYSIYLTRNANDSSRLFVYPIVDLETLQPPPEELYQL
jgi:hypothetical protein